MLAEIGSKSGAKNWGHILCVRDYVYIGNKLLAEYKHQENKYFYYTSDQINSTRIVTDDSGTVVYSVTYDPFGGILKTWVNAYEPALKFSGKERDADFGLDYFGARYYANNQFRFTSVDPVINKDEAISNPQLWNLYSYCNNNPVTLIDPDGKDLIRVNLPGEGKPYLDDTFYPLVQKWVEKLQLAGINITFSSVFRTTQDQKKLRNNPTPKYPIAKKSLHECGFAIDVSDIWWKSLPPEKRKIIIRAAYEVGLMWGITFKTRADPVHFYKEVPGGKENRQIYIDLAQSQFRHFVAFALFQAMRVLAASLQF